MALFASIKGLLNVGVFLLFIMLLFGVVGLHWFQGAMHYTCRVGLPTNTTWHKYSDFSENYVSPAYTSICTPDDSRIFSETFITYRTCPKEFNHDSYCGSPFDVGLSLESENVISNEDIQFGVSTFDHIG